MQSLASVMSWEYLQEERHQRELEAAERADLARERIEAEWLDRLHEDADLVERLIGDPPTDHGEGRGYASAWAAFNRGPDGEAISVLARHYEREDVSRALAACHIPSLSHSVAALVRRALVNVVAPVEPT